MAENKIAVRVRFMVHFRDLFGGKEKEVRLTTGSDIGKLLLSICDTPERRRELLAEGELKTQVVVLKNGIPVQSLKGLGAELADGDTMAIFPFLAGG